MAQQRPGNSARLPLQSRHQLRLSWEDGDAPAWKITYQVLVGTVRKPRALLIAGVHGDEYESVAALQDVAREINPRQLRGTLTIVPVANPYAFFAGTRRTPVDAGDLNRAFPGDPQGPLTERWADLIFRNLVLGSDAVLSMHGWSKEATVVPYVEYPAEPTRVGKKSAALARALGVEFLHPYEWPAGLLVAAAIRHGIPAVESEVGGGGLITPEGQRSCRNIIYGFLHKLRMLDPGPSPSHTPISSSQVVGHSDCRADHPGLFRNRVALGETVGKGDLLGAVYDVAGECVQEVHSPRLGTVAILRTFAVVHPGDLLARLFWPLKNT